MPRAIRAVAAELQRANVTSRFGITRLVDPAVAFTPATDLSMLDRAMRELIASGFNLVEGIEAAARALATEQTSRRIVVAIARIGPGSGSGNEQRHMEPARAALHEAGASLWTVQLTPLTLARGSSDVERFLETVAPETGGRASVIADTSALEGTMSAIAQLIAHQYAVTYESSGTVSPNATLRVGVRRDGVRVYAAGRPRK